MTTQTTTALPSTKWMTRFWRLPGTNTTRVANARKETVNFSERLCKFKLESRRRTDAMQKNPQSCFDRPTGER